MGHTEDDMTRDLTEWFQDIGDLPARTPNEVVGAMKGSDILRIAGEINARRAAGHEVMNLTIGDFDPSVFPIPPVVRDGITAALAEGQTNYPPAIGVPELREAIRSFYADRLGLAYPEGSVQVGAGARPPIYAAFRALLEPGDLVVYPIPTWNVRFYVDMNQARHAFLPTGPETGFMPTAEQIEPHLREARIVVLNSPLNPAGTVIDDALLKRISERIVAENRRRAETGERALYLIFDQVYWQLTFGCTHKSPVNLVPEMARYTIHIDAISKCWAGTGLRVGWAVLPPWLRDNVKPLVGHMGAWAGRAEQIATGRILAEPSTIDPWMDTFRGRLEGLLVQLAEGFAAMADDGLPVRSLSPQGAIYLSVHFDLIGRSGIATDEDLRSFLLQEAGVGVVPFTAFGLPDGSGWVRFSVGTATPESVATALSNIRKALGRF
jgi:aspartate aminotransferase